MKFFFKYNNKINEIYSSNAIIHGFRLCQSSCFNVAVVSLHVTCIKVTFPVWWLVIEILALFNELERFNVIFAPLTHFNIIKNAFTPRRSEYIARRRDIATGCLTESCAVSKDHSVSCLWKLSREGFYTSYALKLKQHYKSKTGKLIVNAEALEKRTKE